ncbi:MAG TPA: ANTAR domain-containing protein [Aeromicrobium sp.]|nr:ANTAR domain-containing protein [Aeromicrobium sp.]
MSSRALAGAIAAMVARFDVADGLNHLLEACSEAYPAEAVAVLVSRPSGGLELLSSTSHRAAEIELLQIQSSSGPCVEALQQNERISASGDEMVERWGEIGSTILAAGYGAVHAYPMHWRGQAIGGLNIFVKRAATPDLELGQMFADLATLMVLQPSDISADQLVARIHEAVNSRAVIEQAKGVLAHQLGSDMSGAFNELLDTARRTGATLTATAADIVKKAYRRS